MKSTFKILALPLIVIITCLFLLNRIESQEGFGITFPAKIVRVLDGDTVEVEIRRVVRIRLLDCWAAETRTTDLQEKKKGLEAKEYLKELSLNKDAVISVPIEADGKFGDSMSMGRVLGKVRIKEGDLSEIMVEKGYAFKTKKDELNNLNED